MGARRYGISLRVFNTIERNKSNSPKKNLILLPQRIACYLTAYFDEQND